MFEVGRGYRQAKVAESRKVNENPDKFYLWTTNKSVRHDFVYDPHAADVWLFESGGGNLVQTNAAGVTNGGK
jgi:hypothetical protein